MWKIEIAYQYTNIMGHLVFDNKEEAMTERDKLLPRIGKDLYDLKKNGQIDAISLVDKFGVLDVVPNHVKAVRCYCAHEWDEYATQTIAENKVKIANKKKELGG